MPNNSLQTNRDEIKVCLVTLILIALWWMCYTLLTSAEDKCWFPGTKRERSRDSISKTFDVQPEEPTAKKSKITAPKGRPTRNSIEPQQKPVSPTVSPTKRRTRLL